MTRSKTRSWLVALGSAVLAATLASAADAEKLKLGNEGDYPPFSITEGSGHLTGFEPELARIVCARISADCDIQAMDFAALLPSLISGKIDMLVSQLAPLPERTQKTDFTIPFIYNPAAFVVPATWTGGFDEKSLAGKRIGAIKGSSKQKYLETVLTGSTPVLYDNIQQIKLDLEAGRLDVGMEGRLTLAYKFLTGPEAAKWKMSESPVVFADKVQALGNEGQSWAVQKGNKALLDRVNTALKQVLADCTFTKTRKQFLPVPITPDEPASCQ